MYMYLKKTKNYNEVDEMGIRITWLSHDLDLNPLSAGDAFKRIHTVFSQLKFDRN